MPDEMYRATNGRDLNMVLGERDAWINALFQDHAQRLESLKDDVGQLQRTLDERLRDVAEQEQARVDTAHDALNERLLLKDRWIETQIRDTRERIAAHERAQAESSTRDRDWIVARLADLESKLATVENALDSQFTRHQETHREFHQMSEAALNEFKVTSHQQADELRRLIDQLRLDARSFITREAFDSHMSAITKTVENNERNIRERLDATVEQIKAGSQTKLTSLEERQQRTETAVSTLGARLQQSILILGASIALIQLALTFLRMK